LELSSSQADGLLAAEVQRLKQQEAAAAEAQGNGAVVELRFFC
jgi:hypothetical protein